MRKALFTLLGIAVVLGSCKKDIVSEDIVQPVLFEYEYVNHAWGYNHNGWMIDENGLVRGFNLPDEWIFPDADGYISKDDIKANMNYTDTTYHTVDNDKMLKYFSYRHDLLNGRIDTSDTRMADAGMSVLSVYVWNESKGMYKKKLLKSQGDLQLTNNHFRTKETINWLVSVGEKTDRFFWGF